MHLFRLCIISLIWLISLCIQITHAAIDYSVTPIRYELSLEPWESITLPASIRNNSDDIVVLPTTTSDFQANGPGWVPSLVRKSELVFPDQELSTWITLWSNSLTLNPGEEWSINFTIDVPINATPGGKYWAVLFRNPGSETWGGDISINVDYGIIILVNVEGEVVVEVEIDDPIIYWGWTWWPWGRSKWYNTNSDTTNSWTWSEIISGTWTDNSNWTENQDQEDDNNQDDNGWFIWTDISWDSIFIYPDVCPLWDFTTSKYDDFEVTFEFPIKNTWNTHIKPTWKVVLKDENGIIKAVGREVIANDRGAIVDQKIVDYVPINDIWGNILPQTKRIFESKWEWFPYKTFDDEWNPIINYWSPSEYYTLKNKDEAGFLMFWERVSENRTHKDITADIELIYYDEDGNPIEFNTAKTFSVQYIEQVVSINPYVVLWLLLIAAAILLTLWAIKWWIILFKKNRCWSCDEKIPSHWKTCPHCRAIQNKRKHKAFEKQKELSATTQIKKVVVKPRKTSTKTVSSKTKTRTTSSHKKKTPTKTKTNIKK